MGRLGALLRPTWRSYAGPPQWHYKAPLCYERLMKGMLRGVLFCPLHRGKSGAARIGGGERSEPVSRMLIKPYDTESQSRNVLASPLGEEGHEVAKGVQANWIHRGALQPANPVRRHPAKSVCARVRMIMIFLFYVLSPFDWGAADWRSGPRWSILSVLCPAHPFPLRGTSPQGETRDMREKTASHILHVPFRRFPPLVAGATTFPPQAGAQ